MGYELAPDIEQSIRNAAAEKGLAIEELLRQTFPPTFAQVLRPIVEPDEARKETAEETHTRVMGLLHKWQKETGMPTPPGGHKTLTQLFAEWEEEDANMTPEQVEEELRFWEDYKRTRDTRGVEI